MIFWELFVSYLKIGFFGFGGGYAMLSLIQNEVVVQHAWMTNAEFADIVAVSQITPGPIAINSATYVGYTVGMQSGSIWYGILGSVIATFAVCLPSMTLMILVARYITRLKGNPLVSGAMRGLRPVVIGMIGAAALLLMFPQDAGDASFIDFWSWILFGGVLAGSYFKLNPILMIFNRLLSSGDEEDAARKEHHQKRDQSQCRKHHESDVHEAPFLASVRQFRRGQSRDKTHDRRKDQT